MKSSRFEVATLFTCIVAGALAVNAQDQGVKITELKDRLKVEIGGQLFTEYRFAEVPRPFCYPLNGPGGLAMSRHWPMETIPNEEHDHPHHRSFWYAHGEVNGLNFWSEEPNYCKIVHQGFTRVESGKDVGVIESTNNWVGPDGKPVCTDVRVMKIYNRPSNERLFDFQITLKAPADKAVVFGDTKEGTMAIRLAESMRLTQPGNKPGQGHILMSNGMRDEKAWGTAAKWLDYTGPVDGKLVGVAIFDHPSNPRYPTTWHARDYGLVAANPFGLHDFQKRPKGAGDLTIPPGGSVTFRYRFWLHEGNVEAQLAKMHDEFAAK